MKTKFLLFVLAFTGMFVGCDKDYEQPNDFSDAAWYTSQFRTEEYKIGVNDFISFADISQNEVEHSWTIEKGSFFLKGPITRSDSILDDFIIHRGETVSKDKTVHVLFTEGGIKKVRLYNTFKEKVTYRGLDTLVARQKGDLWVIDTTFTVDVYDTIVPQILVRQYGLEIPFQGDTVRVEAGDNLEFIDVSTIGRPDTRHWQVAGEKSTDSVATIVFKKLGVFQGTLDLSRSEKNVPADYERYHFPSPIKVIPSSKPFELAGDITEAEDESIQVPFNGEFAPFANQEQYFRVVVNGTEFPIRSVTINPDDATILDIKLVDPIYRPDVITVSYDGQGTLTSTDTRSPVAFTDQPVIMSDINMIHTGFSDFEDGGASWATWWDNEGEISYPTDHPAKGQYSVKLVLKPGQKVVAIGTDNMPPLVFEDGLTYTLTYKMYIDPSSGNTSPNLSMGLFRLPQWQQFWNNFANKPTGEWIEVEADFTGSGATDQLYLRVLSNTDMTSDIIVYYDDFHIVKKEVRP